MRAQLLGSTGRTDITDNAECLALEPYADDPIGLQTAKAPLRCDTRAQSHQILKHIQRTTCNFNAAHSYSKRKLISDRANRASVDGRREQAHRTL
jgi:hypothetical protein